MKTANLFAICLLLFISFLLSACSVVTGIFKAGMGFGIFIVIAVVALIIFLIMRAGRK